MAEIDFDFEELAIVVDLGFEAGLVNGSATIAYESDGEWFVREIRLDGHRLRSLAERTGDDTIGMIERRAVVIDRADRAWLYLAILDQLENGRFKDHVADAIKDDRAARADEHADHERDRRRDDRDEHSTLDRAHQGV